MCWPINTESEEREREIHLTTQSESRRTKQETRQAVAFVVRSSAHATKPEQPTFSKKRRRLPPTICQREGWSDCQTPPTRDLIETFDKPDPILPLTTTCARATPIRPVAGGCRKPKTSTPALFHASRSQARKLNHEIAHTQPWRTNGNVQHPISPSPLQILCVPSYTLRQARCATQSAPSLESG